MTPTDTRLANYRASIKDQETQTDETASLEKELKKMSARAVQRMLREVDLLVLSCGIRGFSEEIQVKIFEGLSKMALSNLLELMDLQEKVKLTQIMDAQTIMASTIKTLRVEGEI